MFWCVEHCLSMVLHCSHCEIGYFLEDFGYRFFLAQVKNHRKFQAQLIYSSVLECESLIRKMLVLQPSKRITIEQIKHHRWMTVEVMETLKLNSNISCDNSTFQPNEQVVRIMQNLGIDSQRTRDSLKVREV